MGLFGLPDPTRL
ncbi:hypothetical protein Pint_25578 [Pistacia integerrima]|uniref:Uncharacterized protein n=1 Tax=Pistacia integerrima TaxID=434235 RepID=A0ACC0YFF0_9ROSI|nr:hypothetical protein Pint_25578 [Pistacia integerrima]